MYHPSFRSMKDIIHLYFFFCSKCTVLSALFIYYGTSAHVNNLLILLHSPPPHISWSVLLKAIDPGSVFPSYSSLQSPKHEKIIVNRQLLWNGWNQLAILYFIHQENEQQSMTNLMLWWWWCHAEKITITERSNAGWKKNMTMNDYLPLNRGYANIFTSLYWNIKEHLTKKQLKITRGKKRNPSKNMRPKDTNP